MKALFKIAATVALMAPALALPVTLHAGDDAEDVAERIYDRVEDACPVRGNGHPYNLAAIADRYFVPDLRDMLADAYAANSVGFDILIDAQDCAIRDVDVDVDGDDDRDRVVARAEFRNLGEPRVVDLLMVRHGGRWLVADIAYRHRDWRLRRDLEVRYTK